MNNPPATVVCFGEILWDFLPRGAFPGGAPFNVAYHLHRSGLRSTLVSAVGHDLLGEELLRRLRHWGLSTDGVNQHPDLPTGYVRAALNPGGDATYEIAQHVAWDEIAPGEQTLRTTREARALVFGSLALRSPANRTALNLLLDTLPASALRVFDVNLRPPFDDLPLVREIARRATVLKLNRQEAARLADTGAGRDEDHARAIAQQSDCRTVCISAGEHGAGLLVDETWHWAPGRPVLVRDTVGAGDAFMAGFLAGLLRDEMPPAEALACACRLGEFVAGQDGATPEYPPGLLPGTGAKP